MAERNSAVHAPGCLPVQFLFAIWLHKLVVRFFPVRHGILLGEGPIKFFKSGWFSHLIFSLLSLVFVPKIRAPYYASTNFERSTFLYSLGNTLMKHPFSLFQF